MDILHDGANQGPRSIGVLKLHQPFEPVHPVLGDRFVRFDLRGAGTSLDDAVRVHQQSLARPEPPATTFAAPGEFFGLFC